MARGAERTAAARVRSKIKRKCHHDHETHGQGQEQHSFRSGQLEFWLSMQILLQALLPHCAKAANTKRAGAEHGTFSFCERPNAVGSAAD
jgi:hypothetical protein